MSIASEITRIAGLRDTIRSKLINFGIISDETAKLSACTTAIDEISESTLSVPEITITIPSSSISINTTSGAITVTGSGSGTATSTKGYSKGASSTVSASVTGTGQITVYDGSIS